MNRILVGDEYDKVRLLLSLAIPYETEHDQSRYRDRFKLGDVHYDVIYEGYGDPTIEEQTTH